jgi:uncharacterized protein YcfJ
MKKSFLFLVSLFVFSGCTTTQKATGIGTVSGATIGGIIGHQSNKGVAGAAIGGAVGALGGYVVGEQVAQKKFCPTGGENYDASVIYCPKHGVELKPVEK